MIENEREAWSPLAADLDGAWRFLPAFRAVAELGSVSAGAEALHVTPPAVSRSLRLLQEAVGVPLFSRAGRGIELTPAGHAMLRAVREAMLHLGDGLDRARGEGLRGPMRVLCPAGLAASVIRGLLALQSDHPELTPDVREPLRGEVATALLRGRADLAITYAPPTHDELDVREVYVQRFALYCGPSHRLFGVDGASLDDIGVDDAFVAVSPTADGEVASVWPHDWPRTVALQVSDLAVRLGLCLTRPLLGVLPENAVAAHLDAGRLWPVASPPLPTRSVYAVRRHERAPYDGIAQAIDAILAALAPT